MWAADAVWGEVLSEQNKAVCSFLSDFVLGENTLPAWAAFLLFIPMHGMLHATLMHYVPNSGCGAWAWYLIKTTVQIISILGMDSCCYLLGWNSSQPKLVQLQSTAEVSAVPKMAESHSVLGCCIQAPLQCSREGFCAWFLCLFLCLINICVGVPVPSMHTGNVCSPEEFLGIPGRQLNTA